MAYIRIAMLMVICALVLLIFTSLPHLISIASPLEIQPIQYYIILCLIYIMLVALIYLFTQNFQRRASLILEQWIARSAAPIEEWVHFISPESRCLAIVVMAGLTLFLELVLIRWQASLFPMFALYKNFTLLACFCGLGIGYALARKTPLLITAALPMLALTLFLLTFLRYASPNPILELLYVVPIQEESAVFGHFVHHIDPLSRFVIYIPVYLLLIGTFILNVLVLMPMGQFCGFLMESVKPLISYGCNLLGSIVGVIALFILSWFWIGPVIWFGVSAAILLWYQLPSLRARRVGLVSVAACIFITAWPIEPLVQNIYSPYQLIQKITKSDGFMQILASGSYYQDVYDLSLTNTNRDIDPLKKIVGYYELPFRTAFSLNRVAIMGAGSGNDVAAALRDGAKKIYAIEIDPVIQKLGRLNHPEHPYNDQRVYSIIDDARTFFRNTTESFDTIVYSVLDSHILLSHGSNIRLDSFVYTTEGLHEAFAHLNDGGLLSVSFVLANSRMGEKIFHMLKALPQASKPVAVLTNYDSAKTTTFMVSKNAEIKLPENFMNQYGLKDVTHHYINGNTEMLDLPTDDWPFFYMDLKMYPASYVVSLCLIFLLSIIFIRLFLPRHPWEPSLLPFFFLGSGFMLIETKAITELGLIFGNTWYVIGITIISVLFMAFLANIISSRFSARNLHWAYLCLLIIISTGYLIATLGGVFYNGIIGKCFMVALLTGPLFFSGFIFSILLVKVDNMAGAMAYNLMGAMLGGLLEYNSMQYGFSFLYLIALFIYGLTWISSYNEKLTP